MTRDTLISIERQTAGAENAFGEPAEDWAELCSEWAKKTDLSDREKTNAGQTYSARLARFVVRSHSVTRGVTTDDRIAFEGVWNIVGVKEIGRNRDVEITAEKKSD